MWSEIIGNINAWAITTGLVVFLTLVAVLVLIVIIRAIFKRIVTVVEKRDYRPGRVKRIKTLTVVFRRVLMIIIVVVGTLTILSELGIDLAPVLTVVGIAGLALSFGAQSLVKDVIAGIFILIENQVRVGDIAQIGEFSGVVEDMNLRTIRLRDVNGGLHIIPNGAITAITNRSKDFARYLFEISVSYKEDVDRVIDVVRELGDEIVNDPDYSEVITEPFEVWGLDNFGESAVTIKARITTRPHKQWEVAREFNRRLKARFDKEGIEIPFPQRVIHYPPSRDRKAES